MFLFLFLFLLFLFLFDNAKYSIFSFIFNLVQISFVLLSPFLFDLGCRCFVFVPLLFTILPLFDQVTAIVHCGIYLCFLLSFIVAVVIMILIMILIMIMTMTMTIIIVVFCLFLFLSPYELLFILPLL